MSPPIPLGELERINLRLQRIIGSVLGACFGTVLVADVFDMVKAPGADYSYFELLLVACPTVLFLASALGKGAFWKWVQVVSLLGFSLAGVADNILAPAPELIHTLLEILMCEMLVVFGYVTLVQYNHAHPVANRLLAGALMVANGLILGLLTKNLWEFVIAFVLYLGILLVFFDWVLGQRFRFFLQAQALAERERESLGTFVRLGLAVNAVTHDVKGRLALQKGLVRQLDWTKAEGVTVASDGSVTLSAQAANRFAEFRELLERSCTDLEGFTTTLRAKLIEDDGPSSFDLRELVRDLTGSMRTGFGLDISTHLPAGTVAIDGRPYPFIQMIENLIRNAVEASKATPQIDVSLKVEPKSVVVTVANAGPPIEACVSCAGAGCLDQKCTVFALGKTTKAGGSGTGMTFVIDTLRRLGGDLRVTCSDGWTSFALTMPRNSAAI